MNMRHSHRFLPFLLCIFLLSITLPSYAEPDWNYIDQLIKARKFDEANKKLDDGLKQFKANNDSKNWTRALITASLSRSARGEMEGAIQYLYDQDWPKDERSQVILNLFYANALTTYLQNNSWEIRQREKIETKGKTSLKKLTMNQLVAETNAAYEYAWIYQGAWKNPDSKDLMHYFKQGTYPKHIRGTLRDTITYLWIKFIGDESLWNASQSNLTYTLKVADLLHTQNIKPSDATQHPLTRISGLLKDLERWHSSNNRPEAALEAKRMLIERLHQSMLKEKNKTQLQQALNTHIQQTTTLPWSNMARWTLAQLQQQSDTAEALIHAKKTLDECIQSHANSIGYKKCNISLQNITAPSFDLQAITTDTINKRSISVMHKNLPKLYLRAWKVDPIQYLHSKQYNNLNYFKRLLAHSKADAQWAVNLPPTRDFKQHQTFITPPMKQFGYWVIVASSDASFSLKNASLSAVELNLSPLTATMRASNGKINVTAYLGDTGQLLPHAKVELWIDNYPALGSKISTATTDKLGQATLPIKNFTSYAILIRHGKHIAFINSISTYQQNQQQHVKSALVFTDRSIYRPEQKIRWKVVAYQGNSKTGNYRTLPKASGWIELRDANYKVVIKKKIQTNAFGSIAGEFDIAQGRLLGNWMITTSWNSSNSIRVEAYKRPTFAVKMDDNKTALRLNQPAKVTGTARYYFGQPVTHGKVAWKVTRKPMIDWRYAWRYRYVSRGTETIASGTSELDDKGQFNVNFHPKADENTQADAEDISYLFEVSADITDTGGETRSTKRNYHLGVVSITATISAKEAFGNAQQPYTVDLSRVDLDGSPQAGSAYWTLNRIHQPDTPQLASELPVKQQHKDNTYLTEGDKIRPRWLSSESSADWFNHWEDGQLITKGTVQHDASGQATVSLKGLAAGLYHLHYSTQDAWGKRFETQHTIIIAATNTLTPLNLASLLEVKNSSAEVGENIHILAGSAFKNTPVMLQIYQGDKLIKQQRLQGGIQQITFPVTKEHRGGLDFTLTGIRDYQLLKQSQHVSIPWSDRQLNVSFSTFRNKLLPGQKESWRITVKDAEDKPLEAGTAEVLASMYDRSLDFFKRLNIPSTLSLYPNNYSSALTGSSQNAKFSVWQYSNKPPRNHVANFEETRLMRLYEYYGYGAMGYRGQRRMAASPAMAMDGGSGTHSHPAIAGCTRQISHNHAHSNPSHQHKYSCKGSRRESKSVNVHALQRKLKASGYYAGPMEGVVSDSTRDALNKYMGGSGSGEESAQAIAESPALQIRKNFNETAFFYPNLTLEKDGSVSFEFEAPESLTEWNVWVSAITRDLRSGSVTKQVRTTKDLMVRPYLPRFLREGDRAEIEVVINNMGEAPLAGNLELEIFNPDTEQSLADSFKLDPTPRSFQVQAGQSTHVRFALNTPYKPGMIAIRTKATAGKLSDGEQRLLSILPSRIHLAQSRFVTLHDKDSKTLHFKQLANNTDPTRINDKLVVTVEGQLFYSVLNALPYLTEYPYECTEQTLNRYLSTSIVKSVFDQYPAVASMAKKLAKRDTKFEQWNDDDPNRKMLLEETPWLTQSEGGKKSIHTLFNILDPKIATAQRNESLQKLRKAQLPSGAFPWWSGGSESPYMTLYMLHGFSRSLEFKGHVPKDMVQKAWRYMHNEYKEHIKQTKVSDKLSEDIDRIIHHTFINYVLSAYPDISWTGGVFNAQERKLMLDESFKHWTKLPPLLQSYLTLTLHRSGRTQDAKNVFSHIMNGAKTDPQLGTFWATEERSWLWFNDNIDTHAFILRTLNEISPDDPRSQGMMQWLMLDKKLNHWKSTRATAESIYALVHYLKGKKQLGIEEKASAAIGSSVTKDWDFKPEEYTGHKNQVVIEGDKVTPDMANITVKKETKGLMFASATWHFSTEKLPQQAQGDFFQVNRTFYKRVQKNNQWTLQPLAEGATIAVGDQLEVQLSLKTKHQAEYVHMRSPRGAGFEPASHTSGFKWQTGIGYFEEIRDSGANYFFERLPAGEYSFKYRLRATTAGAFRTAPAMVQSVYAPEFVAYSSGTKLEIK